MEKNILEKIFPEITQDCGNVGCGYHHSSVGCHVTDIPTLVLVVDIVEYQGRRLLAFAFDEKFQITQGCVHVVEALESYIDLITISGM